MLFWKMAKGTAFSKFIAQPVRGINLLPVGEVCMQVRSTLRSHPDKYLGDHLRGVAMLGLHFLREKSFSLLPQEKAEQICTITGTAHDLGKATRYFQEYLEAPEEAKAVLRKRKNTHHGLFSAVCSYYLAKEVFSGSKGEDEFYPLLCFLVVRRHHGNLGDILDETIIEPGDMRVLKDQLSAIDPGEFNQLAAEIKDPALPVNLSYEHLQRWITGIENENLRSQARKIRRQKRSHLYFLINFSYSLLVDADKTEAAVGYDQVMNLRRFTFPGTLVDHYKSSYPFPKASINKLREEAYREVTTHPFEAFPPGVYSVILPTGMGKTLAVFSFACKLRNALFEKKQLSYRIIYTLPFLSIIDQNSQVIEEIFKANGFYCDTGLLLKHHYLTPKTYHTEFYDFEPDEAKIMVEGWNSEIVVTTFVQLFETLVTAKNKMVRKFHRLANSIIILDEAQTIRHELWPLMKEIFTVLIDRFQCYILFVTATDPLIFPREEVTSLVQREKYFKALNRLQVLVNLEPVGLEDFTDQLEFQPDKSYLFILNTIKAAQDFYHLLSGRVQEEIVFLSSHITPKERLERIKRIKEGKVRFAVTTQLVEAGVDIDFNVVYRDLAPLDSINQAAGRCNRNGNVPGEFHVVTLINDQGKLYCRYIYDPVKIDLTRELLQRTPCYWEKDFLAMIESYYEMMRERCSFDASSQYLEAIESLRYQKTEEDTYNSNEVYDINSFQLIESYPKVDVFVCLDETAEKIWQEFLMTREIEEVPERRRAFGKIKADFYQYVIAVPGTVKNIPPEANGFFFIPSLQLREYYDENTGFITKGVDPLW